MKKTLLILVSLLMALCLVFVSCDEESLPYVVGAGYDTNNNLILEYSDGSTLNLGKINQKGEKGEQGIQGVQGVQGEKGDTGVGISKTELVNGELVITYTDGTTQNLGEIGLQEKVEGTDGLEYYLLPDGTYAVSAGTTKYLEEIVIPSRYNGKTVSQIVDNGFQDAINLKKIVIPNGVIKIGMDAFWNCTSLTSITIPDSVISIGSSAFENCPSLERVDYLGVVEQWCNISFDNYLTNPLSNGAKLYLNGTLVNDLVIPNTVTKIKSYAFVGCSSLTSITIPDSVTSIGSSAFASCTSLESVTIPDSAISIGYSAFSSCTSLKYNEYEGGYYLGNDTNKYLVFVKIIDKAATECKINENAKIILYSAFDSCSSLTSITIPDSVTSIGAVAFINCTSLESITIPDSVTTILGNIFSNCATLKTINCEAISQPDGWSYLWRSGCSATVNWGCTEE